MRDPGVAVGCALVIGLLSGAAQAAPSRADTLIAQANKFAAAGDFANAAVTFQDAYEVEPRPELICNVGVAYNKANDLPRAQRFLTDCVRLGIALDINFMDAVRDRLATIEKQLRAGHFKPVTISMAPAAGAAVTIADWGIRERLVSSRIVWLAFGVHELDATADGYRPEHRTVTVTTRDPSTVAFELARIPDAATETLRPTTAPPPTMPPPTTHLVAHDAPPALPRSDASPPPPSRSPIYVGATITGVALIAAIVTYAETAHAVDHIDVTGTPSEYQSGVSSADHWRDAFYATGAVTVVAAGVTAYLWSRARPYAHTEVNVAPTSGGAAAVLSGSF